MAAISSNGGVITIPYDKDGGGNSVDGIAAGDTVIIGDGDTEYTVATGGVSTKADELSTITLDEGAALPSNVLGTRTTARGEFEVTVSGVALTGDSECTADFTITATSSEGQATKQILSFVVLVPIEPSFEKYVRNVTVPVKIDAERPPNTEATPIRLKV